MDLLLIFLSWLYGKAVVLRRRFYQIGWIRTRRLPARVISVGNLTVGGTGKTPMVIAVAQRLKERGYNPAVLSRGYGGRAGKGVAVVSDREKIYEGPEMVGEEPVLIAKRLPGIPVVVGSDRYRTGGYAFQKWGTDLMILDDGFQYLGIEKDVSLLLVDATNPFGNGYLLPRGILREPVEQLKSADGIVLTKVNLVPDVVGLAEKIQDIAGPVPIFQAALVPVQLLRLSTGTHSSPNILESKKVVCFSGIGNPVAFRSILEQLGAKIARELVFRDHHVYTNHDEDGIELAAKETACDFVITTEKDIVKISERSVKKLDLHALRVDLVVTGNNEAWDALLTGQRN
jgi:tetraacyldisaccharide 4'-kinase